MGDGRDGRQTEEGLSKQSGYGDVTQLGREVYSRAQGEGNWRATFGGDVNNNFQQGGYGQVAPSGDGGRARYGGDVNQTFNPGDQNSNPNGGRSPYGVVAPGYQPGQDNGNGGRSPYGDVAPGARPGAPAQPGGDEVWKPKPIAGVDPNNPWDRSNQPSRTGGGTGTRASTDAQREQARQKWMMDNNFSHFMKLELIGGVTGGLFGGPVANGMSYSAKMYIAKSDGMLSWARTVRDAGAPAEGIIAKTKYGVATVAEKPIAIGNALARKWEDNFGVKTSNGPLNELKTADNRLARQLDEMANKIKPEVEKIQDRLNRQLNSKGEAALTPAEQELMKVNEYLRGGATGPIPPEAIKHLTGEELSALQRYQGLTAEISQLARDAGMQPAELTRYFQAIQGEQGSLQYMEGLTKRLQPRLDQIAEKMRQPGAVLSAEEQAIQTAAEFVKNKGKGTIPTPSAGVLTAEEIAAVMNHEQHANLVKAFESAEGFKKIPADRLRQILPESAELATKYEQMLGRLKPTVEDLSKKTAITEAELALVQRYNFLKGLGQQPGAGVLSTEEAAIVAQRELLKTRMAALEGELAATPKGFNGFMKNFAKGAVVVAGAQFVEHQLDKAIFGKDHANKASWYTDSILMPASLLLPGGWLKKGAAMVGSHLLGKWIDSKLPAPTNPEYSRIFRPNGVEAFAIAGAALIPLRSESFAARMGLVGAAWLGSKVFNYFTEPRSAQEVADEAKGIWLKDKTERSASTLNGSIDEFKNLAKMEEGSVERYRDDWLKRHHDDLLGGFRGASILLTAVGEAGLEQGTKVTNGNGSPTEGILSLINPFASKARAYDYILAGYNLDLGGTAMKNLKSARISIDRAKTQTEKMVGQDNRGTRVERSEIDDLEKVGQRVDADLEKIYGRHDVSAAHKELAEWARKLNQEDLDKKIRVPLKNTIARPGTADPRYLAKLQRDLALVDLAWAAIKIGYDGIGSGGDGQTAAIFYAEAMAALKKARELEAGAPDQAQLETLANDMGKVIPVKVQDQQNNTINNPFGVR